MGCLDVLTNRKYIDYNFRFILREILQLVDDPVWNRRAVNQNVVGSNPTQGSYLPVWRSGQLVALSRRRAGINTRYGR